MLLGIMADTHNDLIRTQAAIKLFESEGVAAIAHCGDLASPEIIKICSVLPFYFVFGNHDADAVPELKVAAERVGSTCLGWAGKFVIDRKQIAMAHGHLASDLKDLLDQGPDYLLCGHSHTPADYMVGDTRRINPGALFRADEFSIAILDPSVDRLTYRRVD